MANQTVTKVPDYWRQFRGYIQSSWSSSNVSRQLIRTSTDASGGHDYVAGYLVNAENIPSVVSCSISVSIKNITTNGGRPGFYCKATGSSAGTEWELTQAFSPSSTEDTSHTFSFSGIPGNNVSEIVFQIFADGNETNAYITAPTASYTYTVPTLGLSVTPSSLYTGATIYGDISEIFGQTISVKFLYNSTVLESFTTNSESFSRQALDSWFTTAGVSGNSLSVTVSISDSLGRSASARVTVNKPTGGTARPVSPSGTTEDATNGITLSWTYSGDGSQSKAELQYKTSSGTWQSLGNVTTAQTYSVSGWYFPVGSIQWRVRVYNSYGYWSEWSSAASFTASYPALSVSASPTTAYVNNSVKLTFGNRSGRTLTVIFKQGSTVLASTNVSADSYTTAPPASWFDTAGVTGNSMTVTATISDSYGRTANTSFSLNKPTGGTARPVAPSGTTEDGTASIVFSWTYSGDGSQSKAELQYKESNGTWKALTSVTTAQTYTAAAWTLPVGSLQWRVRIYNSFGIWSEWSSAASFNVSYPAMSVTVTPNATHYVGQNIKTTVNGFRSGSVTYTYKNGSTILRNTTLNGDSLMFSPPASWFDTAGVTGNSMTVTVTVTDELNRSASTSFTLQKPVGRTATATLPSGSTVNGAEAVTFTWTSSGDGTQTRAQLQWSRDQITWTALADISGDGTTYTAPAVSFPGTTIYWRVRVYSSFNLWGEWSAAKNFTVQYDAVSQVIPVNSPTSGVYNAAAARVFSVALQASGPVYEPFTISAATMYWRAGESGDFTALTMTPNGNTASVTVAAGTFPSGRIEWYASATDTTGRTTETPHYVLTALQTEVEAAPASPINTVESGTGPIIFRWTYNSLDGTEQGNAELQYSEDGETWVDFGTVNGSETTYSAPAGTFPGGTIFWRVRSYNTAGTAGPWSAAVTFVSYAAPVIQSVTGDGRPFATISWQVEDQMAYELEVNGVNYGPYFGEDARSFTLPEPLPDGTYTVAVRAQNRYSLWSAWATAEMSVTNVPQRTLTILYGSGVSASLRVAVRNTLAPAITQQPQSIKSQSVTQIIFRAYYWNPARQVFHYNWERKRPGHDWENALSEDDYSTVANANSVAINISTNIQGHDGWQYRAKIWNDLGEVYSEPATFTYGEPEWTAPAVKGFFPAPTGYFLFYRNKLLSQANEKLIGKTYNNQFYDRTTLGSYTYTVIQRLPGGYYNKGYALSVTSSVDCPMIALLEDQDAEFIPLPYVENYSDGVTINRAVNTVKTQFSGAKYPTVEIGEGETYSASLSTFWLDGDTENADKLEALLKQAVILKTPQGRVLVGVLDRLPSLDLYYKRAYTISLEQMEWRDFIDDVP